MNKGLIIGSILVQLNVSAQPKAGVELYKYMHVQMEGSFQPLAHIQTAKNWYGELRYNYEDAKTLSLYVGKTIADSSGVNKITPMIGFSTGRFTGISFAFNGEAEWKNFSFASQTQYSVATKKNTESFFFSWSEMEYNFGDHFYAGLAMQYTRQSGETDFEPGFLTGLSFKKISFPFYIFSPFRSGRYFILGVNYEFSLKK